MKTAMSTFHASPFLAALRRIRTAISCSRLQVLLLMLLPIGHASAQLMVHPTRIVLEGDQRSAQLEIINNTNRPATYQLSVVNRRMDVNGGFSNIETAAPGELFAEDMLRYSPRRISLAPGAGQVVRSMARKPANLPSGEYRSHLLFSEQLQPSATPRPPGEEPAEGIGISLIPLVGVSIPVIVRSGDTAATVSMGALAVHPSKTGQSATVSLELHRTGNQSVYGDLILYFHPKGGTPREIGRAGGVAVYTPNAFRRIGMQLTSEMGAAPSNGSLTAVYRARPDDGGDVLAEASLTLP